MPSRPITDIPTALARIALRAKEVYGSNDIGTDALPVIRSEAFEASGGLSSGTIDIILPKGIPPVEVRLEACTVPDIRKLARDAGVERLPGRAPVEVAHPCIPRGDNPAMNRTALNLRHATVCDKDRSACREDCAPSPAPAPIEPSTGSGRQR